MNRLILFFSLLAFVTFSCQKNMQQNKIATPGSIMPGAKVYDVTNPASWGGDPALAVTPDDPLDDDGAAINAALQAAADFLDSIKVAIDVSFWEEYPWDVYQQLVYLPPGTYHLEKPIIFPASNAHPGQLYNLEEDLKEQKNLYNDYPELVEKLKARLYAIEHGYPME